MKGFEIMHLLYDTRSTHAMLETSLIQRMSLVFVSFVYDMALGGRSERAAFLQTDYGLEFDGSACIDGL